MSGAQPALAALPASSALPASGAPDRGAMSPRVQQALLTLQHSRQALRAELVPVAAPQASHPGRPGALARLWWRRLRAWPASHLAGEALRRWWQRHPLQPLATGLAAEARGQLRPMLRRHPWASVGLAAALGAAMVAARPWRWAWVDRHVRRAPGAASGWLLRQLAAAPVQATLVSALALLLRQPGAPGTAAQPAPQGTATPPPAHAGGNPQEAPHGVH